MEMEKTKIKTMKSKFIILLTLSVSEVSMMSMSCLQKNISMYILCSFNNERGKKSGED